MARFQRKKSSSSTSATSDAQLSRVLQEDYKRNPGEFRRSSIPTINTKSYLTQTSARGISPMKKWL
jgi:hypothetical protein